MNFMMATICLVGGLFGLMMSFYLSLCFITWISDVVEQKKWRNLWD
jgi:hypothetical protein